MHTYKYNLLQTLSKINVTKESVSKEKIKAKEEWF